MKKISLLALLASSALLLAACNPSSVSKSGTHETTPTSTSQDADTTKTQSAPSTQQQGVRVFFVLAQQQHKAGLTEIKLQDGSLWADPEPFLGGSDLARVSAQTSPNNDPFVLFNFTSQGKQKLEDTSRKNQGKLIVAVVGNQLEGIIPIRQTISNGMLGIQTPTAKDANGLVDMITGHDSAAK